MTYTNTMSVRDGSKKLIGVQFYQSERFKDLLDFVFVLKSGLDYFKLEHPDGGKHLVGKNIM